jgi:acyl-CoA synthetase (NDP forming)
VLAAARSAGKHVVLVKAGASERSAQIALSHTASVAGTDAVISDLLRRHGVIRAADTEELVRTVTVLNYLSTQGRGTGEDGGLAVLEGSGGAAAQVADNLESAGARLAQWSAATLDALQAIAPPGAYVQNPVDLTASPKAPGAIDQAYGTVYRDPDVAAVFVPWALTFPAGNDGRELHEETMDRYCLLTRQTGTPTIFCAANVQRWTPWIKNYRREHPEMLVVRGLGATVRALASIYPAPREHAGHAPDPAPDAGTLVGEAAGREILGRLGAPLAAGFRWQSPFAAVAGVVFPCVVKAVVPGLAHRARLGAVVVGCRDQGELAAARDTIVANLDAAGIGADRLEGLLVEEMVFGPELLIGFNRDPWYGPYVVLARGGVNVEEQRPVLLDLPPDRAKARDALADLGLIGSAGQDLAATADLIADLSIQFVDGSLASYRTVELNPVILTAAGPKIADVLLVRA